MDRVGRPEETQVQCQASTARLQGGNVGGSPIRMRCYAPRFLRLATLPVGGRYLWFMVDFMVGRGEGATYMIRDGGDLSGSTRPTKKRRIPRTKVFETNECEKPDPTRPARPPIDSQHRHSRRRPDPPCTSAERRAGWSSRESRSSLLLPTTPASTCDN